MSLIVTGIARGVQESSTRFEGDVNQIVIKDAAGTVLLTVDSDGTIKIGANKVIGAQGAAIADLTHAFGTADGTIADVGAAFSQATLNDNLKELSAKVNLILARMRLATGHGLIA